MIALILSFSILFHGLNAHPPTWLGKAIDYAITHDGGPKQWTPEFTAAVMVQTAWDEGQFCAAKDCIVGDKSWKFGAHTTWQIRARSEVHAKILDHDPNSAARFALAVIRIGAKQCPDHPLAPYAGGCANKAAQVISAARLRKAERMLVEAKERNRHGL